jgi:hypothetical protein
MFNLGIGNLSEIAVVDQMNGDAIKPPLINPKAPCPVIFNNLIFENDFIVDYLQHINYMFLS